ncbi:MAG: PEP-CTERM sorting domain-containing protein [Planctomycetota bacterium]|nr:PEP-CTERM sorting domain-containing protein [Planctomycetota bacterium]
MRQRASVRLGLVAGILLGSAAIAQAAFIPWDPLVKNAETGKEPWIAHPENTVQLTMYTANGGSYLVGFDQIPPPPASQVAKGMNALKFSYGGSETGNLSSSMLTDSFTVKAGGGRAMTDVLLLIAIDAPSLPAGFGLTLTPSVGSAYTFNPAADFGYYDHPTWDTGRPSGYYGATSPTREDVAYDFSTGMATVFALPGANLSSTQPITFNYAFTNLPGRAVFSVYGRASGSSLIYHTNRAVPDGNPGGSAVSTFEVAPEPATLALAAFGAAGLLARRTRCPRAQR